MELASRNLGLVRSTNLSNCPAMRPKKESGDSDRDVNDLLGRESYKSEAKSWRGTPPRMADGGRAAHNKLHYSAKKEATFYRGN